MNTKFKLLRINSSIFAKSTMGYEEHQSLSFWNTFFFSKRSKSKVFTASGWKVNQAVAENLARGPLSCESYQNSSDTAVEVDFPALAFLGPSPSERKKRNFPAEPADIFHHKALRSVVGAPAYPWNCVCVRALFFQRCMGSGCSFFHVIMADGEQLSWFIVCERGRTLCI